MLQNTLGTMVRGLRASRRMTLRTLAEHTGFSAAFLSQVEHGQASPSISSMERIARALGVTLGEFFQATEAPQLAVVRTSERTGLVSQWSRARIESLGPSRTGQRLGGLIITIEPGGSSGKRPYPHDEEQITLVLDGDIVLTLDSEEHRLCRGDAATIRVGVASRWHNDSRAPAQILIVSAR